MRQCRSCGLMEIPYTELSDEALRGIIEEYITREGTEYGRADGRTGGPAGGRADGRTGGRTGGWADGRVDGRISEVGSLEVD